MKAKKTNTNPLRDFYGNLPKREAAEFRRNICKELRISSPCLYHWFNHGVRLHATELGIDVALQRLGYAPLFE